MLSIPANGLAFGVDSTRRERYSLRQARYFALGETVGPLAADAKKQGETFRMLDIGIQHGVSRRYIERHPDTDQIDYHGADLALLPTIYRPDSWTLYTGDLTEGYPQIPSNHFDVVVCEQVLEHLPTVETAMKALSRVLKPGGTMIVGVPIFPFGLHLARRHIVPIIDALNPWARSRGHLQAFSLRSFTSLLKEHAEVEVQETRGFRIISGGVLRPLENQQWWWKMNCKLGKMMPGLCIETQVVATKPQAEVASVRKAA